MAFPGLRLFASLRLLWRRWFLWVLLAVLVVALLVTVVWLAGRHETEQMQAALDHDTADAAAEVRVGFENNVQRLRTLPTRPEAIAHWNEVAAELLQSKREWLRLAWFDAQMHPVASAYTPYRPRDFGELREREEDSDISLACAAARKLGGAAYSPSHYVPLGDGTGIEAMELCLVLDEGYLVASYSLRDTLEERVGPTLRRGQEVAFTEVDGTRLAVVGGLRRSGSRIFISRQLVNLPGVTLILRVDGWRAEPDLFPNLLTGLVTAMSIALVGVLVLLAHDTRLRLRAENDLADALAFRKAMEDSLITGLRARDLQGRITYVNPAFCAMVGFSPEELLGQHAEAQPYWPTGMAGEYKARRDERHADGALPPREGFETVFMRKNGTRFPVLIFDAPLINAHGVQAGWMSAFIDVSEQRRMEELSRATFERLQASARLATVGEMASLLSHELTQPLAAIASYASGSLNLIETEGDGARADVSLALGRIAQQAGRAGQVIRSVHDFVRRRERTREAVAPPTLIDAVLPLVRLQAAKLGVRIDVRIEPGLPRVQCDRTLVEQVLLNLARNAMQAMDAPDIRERILTLGARHARVQRGVEFAVTDVGLGISSEVAARLFTPFFTTRADGMGLGLSLCRTVVEQHGGVLIFEPNLPRGTTFRFVLA